MKRCAHTRTDLLRPLLCGCEPLQDATHLHSKSGWHVPRKEKDRDAPTHLLYHWQCLQGHASGYIDCVIIIVPYMVFVTDPWLVVVLILSDQRVSSRWALAWNRTAIKLYGLSTYVYRGTHCSVPFNDLYMAVYHSGYEYESDYNGIHHWVLQYLPYKRRKHACVGQATYFKVGGARCCTY